MSLLVVALFAAACGDDGGDPTSSGDDTTAPDTAAPTTTAVAPDTSTTRPPDPPDTMNDPAATLAPNVLDFSSHPLEPGALQQVIDDSATDPSLRLGGTILGEPVTVVQLRGKTNHFGRHLDGSYIDYDATVPDTTVWIAEHPETRALQIATDDTGWWTMYIVKDTGVDLEFSFVFEKPDWITTKTNIITVGDVDDTDLAIQYIDPDFYRELMLPFVSGMVIDNGHPDFEFQNAMVVTVGKTWASMHDDRLPHGDPGATTTSDPEGSGSIGPIYFNEDVIPDVAWPSTSLDGGVVWLNMRYGETYSVTADKEGVTYPTVRFTIDEADRDAGVQLYIASPPDSLEGSNDSPPGED